MRVKADLTNADDPAVQQLTKQYAIVGVPTVVLHRLHGDGEQQQLRLTGFEKAGAVPRAHPAGAVNFQDVQRVRERIARAHSSRASRFRDAFAAGPILPVAHMRIQAAALIECAEGVRLNGEIALRRHRRRSSRRTSSAAVPIYPFFEVDRHARGDLRILADHLRDRRPRRRGR